MPSKTDLVTDTLIASNESKPSMQIMPTLAEQVDVTRPSNAACQQPNSFASRVKDYWARKQELLSDSTPSPADSFMVRNEREGRQVARNIERGTPGDRVVPLEEVPERKELAKKKSQYYDDAFAFRESNTSARERVYRESMVMVEVRTNVIVSDEYTFITDLSHNLSGRYQRPESSILVILTHSVCLLLGGSFDPAYTMTVTALPSQVQPVTNKRNAILLAKLLEESLGVPPSRSLIKFVGIQEENFAYNGKTAAAEIELLEKEPTHENTSMKRTVSQLGAARKQSKRSMRNLKVNTADGGSVIFAREPLSPSSERSSRLTSYHSEKEASLLLPETPTALPDRYNATPAIPPPPMPTKMNALDKKAVKTQKIGHRKSFMSGLFGRQNG